MATYQDPEIQGCTKLTHIPHTDQIIVTRNGDPSVKTSYMWTHLLIDAKILTFVCFLDEISSFMRAPLVIMYLMCDFGLSGYDASLYFAYHGIACVLCSIVLNAIFNYSSATRLMWIGTLVEAVGIIVLVGATELVSVEIALFVLMPVGIAIGGPVITRLTKQYVFDPAMDKFSVMQYIIGNVSAILGFTISDAIQHYSIVNEWTIRSYRAVFLLSVLLDVVYIVVILSGAVRNDVFVDDTGITWRTPPNRNALVMKRCAAYRRIVDHQCPADKHTSAKTPDRPHTSGETVMSGVKATLTNRAFWKLTVVAFVIAIGTGSAYRFMDTVYPAVMENTFGADSEAQNDALRGCINARPVKPSDTQEVSHVPWNALMSIDPIVCIGLSFPVNAFIIEPYLSFKVRIMSGTLINAISMVGMAISMNYASVVLFITLMSVAEIVWAPSMRTFATRVSPEKYIGIWMSVSGMPRIVARFFSGLAGAMLLEHFCDSSSHCDTMSLWFTAVGISLFTPVVLGVIFALGLFGEFFDQVVVPRFDVLGAPDKSRSHADTLIVLEDQQADDDTGKLLHTRRGVLDQTEIPKERDTRSNDPLIASYNATKGPTRVWSHCENQNEVYMDTVTSRGTHIIDTSAFEQDAYSETIGNSSATKRKPENPYTLNPSSSVPEYYLREQNVP